MKGIFYSKGAALFPDGDDADKIMRGMTDGEVCELEIKKPGNITLLRKYWKLCEYIAQSCPGVETSKQVDHILKLKTGNVEVFQVGDVVYQMPGSIAFAKMESDEFGDYYRRCIKVIVSVFLPHSTEQALTEEIERMVGVRY